MNFPLLNQLQKDYPNLNFSRGEAFSWSPKDRTVTYTPSSVQPDIANWSLLHEVSHGILDHTDYTSDFELVQLEVEAWKHANALADTYNIRIDEDHIQDCLDTYRDWLHRRSTCPVCSTVSTQADPRTYRCFNCKATWRVSHSRFCRPYRRLAKQK